MAPRFSRGRLVERPSHACRLVVAQLCYFAIQHRQTIDSRTRASWTTDEKFRSRPQHRCNHPCTEEIILKPGNETRDPTNPIMVSSSRCHGNRLAARAWELRYE